MRLFNLTMGLLIVCTTYAQAPYQLFRPGVDYLYENPYYERDLNSLYLAVRVDSVGCFEQALVVKPDLFNWLLSEDELCFQPWPAFIGEQICQTETLTTFTGLRNDFDRTAVHQMEIHQQASVGSSWFAGTRSNFSTTDSIYALVQNVFWESPFGRADSVKYIALYEGPIANDNIVASIRIGRNLGLLEMPDLNYPYELAPFVLMGVADSSSSTLTGSISQPTAQAIYSQEIGDERHLFETEMYIVAAGYYIEIVERQQRLLEQWRDEAEDYLWQVWESRDRSYQYGDAPQRPDTIYRQWRDTSRINLRNWPDNPLPVGSIHTLFEDELPTQAVWSWEEEPTSFLCNQLRLMRLRSFLSTEGCIQLPPIHSDPNPWYYNRFGGPYYSRIYAFDQHSRRILVYYRTAEGDECGNPYDFVVSTDELRPQAAPLQLYPNPTSSTLHWRTEAGPPLSGQAEVLNAQGQVLQTVDLQVGQLDVSALPAGVYWLRCRDQAEQWQRELWIKQ